MTKLKSTIATVVNSVLESVETGIRKVVNTSCIAKSDEKNSRITKFGKGELSSNLEPTETVIKFTPFINEIIFKGELVRLRLIGNEFILEKYHSRSDLTVDKAMASVWNEDFDGLSL